MEYKSTSRRQIAEERFGKSPTKRNLASLSKASDAEMKEVLAAFDARNNKTS